MLWTDDLDGTVAFYTDILGFTCREKNEDWGWASLVCDDVWIMLAKPNAHERYEKIGFTGPDADVELIAMTARLWRRLGIERVKLNINSLGTPESRRVYREKLVAYFRGHESRLDDIRSCSRSPSRCYARCRMNLMASMKRGRARHDAARPASLASHTIR